MLGLLTTASRRNSRVRHTSRARLHENDVGDCGYGGDVDIHYGRRACPQ
jgi:hypothetical protein